MLFVRSYFGGAVFADNESVAVYDDGYEADRYGNKLDENDERLTSGDCYAYGDIVFVSSSMKVIFKRVYASYEWCSEILNYIQKHINDKAIVIDLNALIQRDGEYREFDCGDVVVMHNGN